MSGGNSKAPLPGRIVGFALAVTAVAGAFRIAWELLEPVLPTLSGLVMLAALLGVLGKLRR